MACEKRSAAVKILHVSTYDSNGGAGRAAYALHAAMLQAGLQSSMLVAQKNTSDPTVQPLSQSRNLKWRAAQFADRKLWNIQASLNSAWRSPGFFGALNADYINDSDADIVNLHWVTNGFLSIREISRIKKPLVWSLYDMWVFSGAAHYGNSRESLRRTQSFTRMNRSSGDGRIDLERITWNRKVKYWTKPIHLVPASTWLASESRASALAGSWPTSAIAHVVDTDQFAPMNQLEARLLLSLPTDVPLILFLSSAGIQDERKGWDLLEQGFSSIHQNYPSAEIVVAGPAESNYTHASGIKISWLGEVRGNHRLRALYAAADVVVVPSREDNMPLTAMEAQSVGMPVVAFDIGGLPDIVNDGLSGRLVRAFDVHELASAILEVLTDTRTRYSEASRTHALQTWSPSVVVERYVEIYEQVIAASP